MRQVLGKKGKEKPRKTWKDILRKDMEYLE